MQITKKINLLVTMACLTTVSLMAQRPGFQHLERMEEELGLNAGQKESVEGIFNEFRSQMEMLRDKGLEDRTERHEAMKALQENLDNELKDVFTEEQYEKYTDLRPQYQKGERKPGYRGQKGLDKEDRAELKAELKEYHEKTIRPVLLKARQEFDPVIAQEDQLTLDELRISFEKHKAEQQVRKQEFRQDKKPDVQPNREMREKRRKDMRQEHESFRDNPDVKALRALVEKYNSDLEKAFESLEKEHQNWQEDLRAIHEKYRKTDRENQRSMRHHSRRGHQDMRGKDMMPRKGRFLLMDPEAIDLAESNATKITGLKVFPNPTSNAINVAYTLKSDTKVRIELRNNSGALVDLLGKEKQSAGDHQMQYQIDKIQDGIYHLYVIHKDGTFATQKVIVSK